jgi:hypothetical protein
LNYQTYEKGTDELERRNVHSKLFELNLHENSNYTETSTEPVKALEDQILWPSPEQQNQLYQCNNTNGVQQKCEIITKHDSDDFDQLIYQAALLSTNLMQAVKFSSNFLLYCAINKPFRQTLCRGMCRGCGKTNNVTPPGSTRRTRGNSNSRCMIECTTIVPSVKHLYSVKSIRQHVSNN